MPPRLNLERRVKGAVRIFWKTRETQTSRQGSVTGTKDAGARRAVTGGAQMRGFIELVRDALRENGVQVSEVHCDRAIELPGWYRPEKKWDLLLVSGGALVPAIEFKSHVGPSFGNNFNNRTEEALGSATDLWAAYREGAFQPSARPWLGYLMLLEECQKSASPVHAKEPHFPVFPEFEGASYEKRYEILLTKMVRERLYDSACLLTSTAAQGRRGAYHEPSSELTMRTFVSSSLGRAIASKRFGG